MIMIFFINGPPSLHKHSLHALKSYVHLDSTLIIFPLIWWPLGESFDEDYMHVFYAQSLEYQAEFY